MVFDLIVYLFIFFYKSINPTSAGKTSSIKLKSSYVFSVFEF